MWNSQVLKLTLICTYFSVGSTAEFASEVQNEGNNYATVKNTIFTAVSSKLVRPNIDYKIFINVEPSEFASPLIFNASLGIQYYEGYRDPNIAKEPLFSSELIQIQPGRFGLLTIPVKDLPNDIGISSYKLTLRAFHLNNNESFDETTSIYQGTKNSSLLLQTDKPVYKPGDTLQFRVVLMDRFLRPLNQKSLNITIEDPKQNIIKQWKDVQLNDKGLFSSKLDLSSEPILGDWKIRVQDFSSGATETIKFTVDEYVLPKFKVDVNVPSFLTYNNSKFLAEIKAAYTYGKPIQFGSVQVQLSEYYQRIKNYKIVKSIVRKAQINENGSVFIEFDPVKDLSTERDGYNRDFIVEASVTDGITGRTQNGSALIKIYKYKFKVEVIQPPPNYKPGFRMSLLLKMTRPDGTPIAADPDEKAVKVAHGYAFNEKDGFKYFSIPPTGIIKFDLDMPTNQLICSGSIEVTYKGVTRTLDPPKKFNSPSRTYVQLTILTETPELGSFFDVHVKLSKPFNGLNYLLIGRGEVLSSSHVETNGQVNEVNFTIPIVDGAAPEATVLVYTVIKPNNEVAVDSKRFNIDTVLHNHLNLSLSKTTAEPGEKIDLNVYTESGSLVALRGIDQSVILLKEDKDITRDTIDNEIKSYQSQLSSHGSWGQGAPDALQMFNQAGVAILTNGRIARDYASGYGWGSYSGRVPPPKDIRVRTKFPETWLWEEIEVNNSRTTLSKVVPDTLTSWLITGFSLNKETGIGVTLQPSVLETFRPFFLTLNVPYSIVRGETFDLQVLVHNYMKNSDAVADITLSNTNQEFIFNDEADKNAAAVTKQVQLEPVSVQLVTFTITPTKFGIMKLNVKGVTPLAGDALSQPLIVKPPGQKHVQSKTALLDLRAAKSASYQLEAKFPTKRVEGADQLKLTVVADLLGTTISNLDKLIQLPSGCGEQNMVNFVPDIVILDYLKTVGSLTPEIQAKAIKFLETGYQKQLTYRHDDGSYSAFGNSDAQGSTWLTAFVIRSFVSAKPWITIDHNVLVQGLGFLAGKQHQDGSFIELGRVLHSDMQGGSSGTLALSAYGVLAFIEAKALKLSVPAPAAPSCEPESTESDSVVSESLESESHEEQYLNFDQVISKGLNYIIKSFNVTKEDPYSMNLITYALTVAERPEKDSFLEYLEGLGTKEADLLHWRPPQKNETEQEEEAKKKGIYWHGPRSTKPISVEMSSYGLMTYLHRNDLEKALSVGKWLLLQQNAEGGFISTQDTVVGLTALARFAMATRSPTNNLKINASYNGGSESFNVNNANAIVLQEAFLPESIRQVNLDVNGEGTALGTLTWTYYVEDQLEEPTFTISPTILVPKPETIDLLISTSFLRPVKSSNMAVMEVNLPSGYVFDSDHLPSLRKYPKVMRYELEDGGTKTQIYFDSLNSKPSQVKLTANRLFKVKNSAKAYITIYDYYDTTLKAIEFYKLPKQVGEVGKDCVEDKKKCA